MNTLSRIECCFLVALHGYRIVSFGSLFSVTFPSWTASHSGEIRRSRASYTKDGSRDDGTSSARWRQRTATDESVVCTAIGRVRNILPSKYYAIDSNRMRQILLLNCQLLGDVPYNKRGLAAPKLTSDDEGCGSDIFDRCGRPRERSFLADEENLFLDHIYSTSYSTLPKRHLTSFAVKRDFFRAFFGSEEDDLDQ